MTQSYHIPVKKGERRDRKRELQRLAEARKMAKPEYVVAAAGFWLKRMAPPEQRPHGN